MQAGGEASRRLAALALLALLAPLLALLAIAIGACGRTPLFRQTRVGAGGDLFVIFKLRTLDGPEPRARRRGRDAAFARIGHALRRTRLDELPQLLNIARGEMSFVGPRPLLPEVVAAMPEGGTRRLTVKPGLTGLAQVSGGQLLSPTEKLALDLDYIERRGLALDAWILLRTIGCSIGGDGNRSLARRERLFPGRGLG